MFSHRILTVIFAGLLLGCGSPQPKNDEPIAMKVSETTPDGLIANAPYKIEEADIRTGKIVRTYFALGKDIDLDEFGGVLKFRSLDGKVIILDGSFEFSQDVKIQ